MKDVGPVRGDGGSRETTKITGNPWVFYHEILRIRDIPSGKLLHNYGKSSVFMGKSTINGHFPWLR